MTPSARPLLIPWVCAWLTLTLAAQGCRDQGDVAPAGNPPPQGGADDNLPADKPEAVQAVEQLSGAVAQRDASDRIVSLNVVQARVDDDPVAVDFYHRAGNDGPRGHLDGF